MVRKLLGGDGGGGMDGVREFLVWLESRELAVVSFLRGYGGAVDREFSAEELLADFAAFLGERDG